MHNPIQNGPLAGIQVLDFTTLLPGPMATLFLSETGANVIKIEKPDSGDTMRTFLSQLDGENITFSMLNQGKQSLSIDLKDSQQRKLLDPLIQEVDIIIEQFRPGVMDRLNLGYKAISNIKPNIIYCSITGYGQSGPKQNITGHDLNYIGDSGLLSLSMGSPNNPTVPPALIADIAGGSYPAIINILLALRLRDQTGQGSYIDISMTESLFPFLYWAIGQGIGTNKWPKNGTSIFTGGSPRYNLYKTSDNKFLAAAPLEEKFWKKFCAAINLDKSFRNDSDNPRQTISHIRKIISKKDSEYWKAIFSRANCCCSIVKTIKEAILDPQTQARQVLNQKIQTDSGKLSPALPIPIMSALRCKKGVSKAPKLGNLNKSFIK